MDFCHNCVGEGFAGEVERIVGSRSCDWKRKVIDCGFERLRLFESGVQMISGQVAIEIVW